MEFNISLNNPLVKLYAFYASVLIMKMILMSLLTAAAKHGMVFKQKKSKDSKSSTNEDVSRVKRAHLNDLENIPAFLFISGLYLLTNPAIRTATILMAAYTITRGIHTLIYAIWVVPQPARGISWGLGFIITFYMAIQVVLHVI